MDNRERILQCALELFYAKGYDAVGVQEIAQKAGITKPTLYYYFGSKYGLLETLLTKHFTVLNEELERASFYEGDVGATLYNIASAFLDYAMRNYKVYALLMAMFYSAKENEAYRAVKPLVKKFYSQIVHFFDTAEHELGNMNGRQEQFAIGFIGLINHYILLADRLHGGNLLSGNGWTVLPEQTDRRRICRSFLQRGLSAAAAAQYSVGVCCICKLFCKLCTDIL